jgi:uncharacterized membrane protein
MYELLKMAHLIVIAMASGLMLSHYIMLRASAGLEGERGVALARRTLADVTSFAVAFMWITGLTLLWSRYGAGDREVSAWFYAKLVFVVLFTVAHVMQRISAARMRRIGDLVALRRVAERWLSAAWLSTLLVICLAVVSFSR